MERAAYNHLISYANILRKRKIVQEEDEINLKNTKCRNSTLDENRFNCKGFLESEDSKSEKPHKIRIEDICTEMSHPL